jgi:hypothetical protein
MKHAYETVRLVKFTPMFAAAMLAGCGTAEQIAPQAPSASPCSLKCPSGRILASETTLGRCTVYVVDQQCVASLTPGGCRGDADGYKVLLKNHSGAVVKVRNEALQKGKWVAHWRESKEVQPGGSYGWGIAATHGKGARLACP